MNLSKEEYAAQLKGISAKVAELKTAELALKQQWIKQAPFKEGDLVDVTIVKSRGVKDVKRCYISKVGLYSWGECEINYSFSKVKNDGTMSLQSAGIGCYDKIELVCKKTS